MISVITWDACFREALHTIECFLEQDLQDFEFIWVDYYQANSDAVKLCGKREGFKTIALDYPRDSKWHLGKCINAGVRVSTGQLLVIPDGDVFVAPDFLSVCTEEHRTVDDAVVYFRRFDEPRPVGPQGRRDLGYLMENTTLVNPTNYAGCVTLKKSLFQNLRGYEEHPSFSGPGINGMELHTRIRNSGAYVRWSEHKIFHPWHESSGDSGISQREKDMIVNLAAKYRWVHPYGGLAQSWIVRQRELSLSVQASLDECEKFLSWRPRSFRFDE